MTTENRMKSLSGWNVVTFIYWISTVATSKPAYAICSVGKNGTYCVTFARVKFAWWQKCCSKPSSNPRGSQTGRKQNLLMKTCSSNICIQGYNSEAPYIRHFFGPWEESWAVEDTPLKKKKKKNPADGARACNGMHLCFIVNEIKV